MSLAVRFARLVRLNRETDSLWRLTKGSSKYKTFVVGDLPLPPIATPYSPRNSQIRSPEPAVGTRPCGTAGCSQWFGLVGLLVVMAIVGTLAGLSLPAASHARDGTQNTLR